MFDIICIEFQFHFSTLRFSWIHFVFSDKFLCNHTCNFEYIVIKRKMIRWSRFIFHYFWNSRSFSLLAYRQKDARISKLVTLFEPLKQLKITIFLPKLERPFNQVSSCQAGGSQSHNRISKLFFLQFLPTPLEQNIPIIFGTIFYMRHLNWYITVCPVAYLREFL